MTRRIAMLLVLLAIGISAAAQTDPIVYAGAGGLVYHKRDCTALAGLSVEKIKLSAIGNRVACDIRKPEGWAPPKRKSAVADGVQVAYVITAPTTAHATAAATANVVNRYKLFDVVLVKDAEPGWFYVEPATTGAATNEKGWIRGTADNLMNDGLLDTMLRIVKVEEKTWPVATKIDIVRRRPRIGFTQEQVETALGEPLTRQSEETAAGVTEGWMYADQMIVFTAGRVASIKKSGR